MMIINNPRIINPREFYRKVIDEMARNGWSFRVVTGEAELKDNQIVMNGYVQYYKDGEPKTDEEYNRAIACTVENLINTDKIMVIAHRLIEETNRNIDLAIRGSAGLANISRLPPESVQSILRQMADEGWSYHFRVDSDENENSVPATGQIRWFLGDEEKTIEEFKSRFEELAKSYNAETSDSKES